MPAPGQSTFDGNTATSPATTTGYRPGAADFNGAALVDDTSNPPDPSTMPTSACWNTFAMQHVSVGKAISCAGAGVGPGSTAPAVIQYWYTAANSVTTNPFYLKRGSTGDYKLLHSGAASTWGASTGYSSTYPNESYVQPTTQHANGYWFESTTGGTSGGTEPTWPSTVGNTVADGSVVWTCRAPLLPVGLPIAGWPRAHVNALGGTIGYAIQSINVTGGVRVNTQSITGGTVALADTSWSVDLF